MYNLYFWFQVLAIEGSEVLKCDIIAYNNGTEGSKFLDMSCVDTSINVTMGCMRLVFLNKFVNDLLVSILKLQFHWFFFFFHFML